jgi:hypothetical protein
VTLEQAKEAALNLTEVVVFQGVGNDAGDDVGDNIGDAATIAEPEGSFTSAVQVSVHDSEDTADHILGVEMTLQVAPPLWV